MTKTDLKNAEMVWCKDVECEVVKFPSRGMVTLETMLPHLTLTDCFTVKYDECSKDRIFANEVATIESLKAKMRGAVVPLLISETKRLNWHPGRKVFEILRNRGRDAIECKTVTQAKKAYNDSA